MSNDYSEGGLRLVKVDLFFEALKCTWIRRIVNGNIDAKGLMLFSILTGIHINDLEKGANYTINVAKNSQNVFWKEVLLAWSKVKKKHNPNTIDDVLRSCLWENEWFKIGGAEINYKKWRTAGIDFVSDLVHVNQNRFLFLHEIETNYGLRLNFLEYNSVIRAIKSNFKHLFQENATFIPIPKPFIPFHFSFILKDKKGCRSICKQLMSLKIPKAKQKWEVKLNSSFSDDEWKIYSLLPFKCTMDTKLRWFQYRILNGILTTNTFMFKIGKRNDNICTFCNEEPETINHLLSDCKKVKPIWSQLETWCLQKLGIPITFNQNHILFGTDLGKINSALNLILILSKFYIYRKRCQNSTLSFIPLQKEIEYYHKLERFILLKDSKYRIYQNKWQVWKGLFN